MEDDSDGGKKTRISAKEPRPRTDASATDFFEIAQKKVGLDRFTHRWIARSVEQVAKTSSDPERQSTSNAGAEWKAKVFVRLSDRRQIAGRRDEKDKGGQRAGRQVGLS